MAEKAQSIQDRINVLQEEVHRDLLKNATGMDEARNKIFAAREKEIESLMAKDVQQPGTGLAPDFWAKAIISGLDTYDKESQANTHFLGPYDKELLNTYLISMKVENTLTSQKLVLHFKPNPFFEETSLWAELHFPPEDAKEADDDDESDDHWVFSGITWKPSHGPVDDEEDSADEQDRQSSAKRERDDSSPSSSTTLGPSMLEVFSSMPPHPTKDEEFLAMLEDDDDDEEAEDGLEEAIENWEDEMQDREKLLSLLLEDIYQNPVEAILAAETLSAKEYNSDLPQSKKNKPE